MNEPDIEQQLRAARLAAPSDRLDRRLDEVFRLSPGACPTARPPASWWWRLGLSMAGAVAVHMFVRLFPWSAPAVVPVAQLVYRVEPAGLMRESLLTPPAASRTPPAMIVTVQTNDSTPSTSP